MIRPTGNRVLLKRLDGDGREEQLASGIWKPARDESLHHGNAARVPMTFRALVLAVGDGAAKATQGDLQVGQTVLVYTYEQTSSRTLTGDETPYGLLVDVDNIIGVEETSEQTLDRLDREHEAALNAMPLLGMVAKQEDFKPSAVSSLGFHRRTRGF